jgi:CubicO group peptidase (beta-lactamase class C family)
MSRRLVPFVLAFVALASPGAADPVSIEDIVDDVVVRHMLEKRIPGMSVAVVHEGRLVLSKGYGKASVEFDVPATATTVYPISSVSKIFAGLLAIRLVDAGYLDLDESISSFISNVPADKRSITVRHLLQHTHGLEDFYQSAQYETQTGKSMEESTADELFAWSLAQPLRYAPGAGWEYSLSGYVLLARILEQVGETPYLGLVQKYVFEPLNMIGTFGSSEAVITGRNPVLYKLVDDDIAGHIVDFPPRVYAAGGLNMSALEMAKLFVALAGEDFITDEAKGELWHNPELTNGELANYGLGWFSYETSKKRWVVGHEGGGASWVIFYPDENLAVIALSNLSGARADILPYEIARKVFATNSVRVD